jgi:hypothetical protein
MVNVISLTLPIVDQAPATKSELRDPLQRKRIAQPAPQEAARVLQCDQHIALRQARFTQFEPNASTRTISRQLHARHSHALEARIIDFICKQRT